MKRTALIILDGWGNGPEGPGNCVWRAKTPHVDRLRARFPGTEIATSGRSVGLPDGQMGNSEVGHLTLGAGRIVPQDLVRIGDAVDDGSFFSNEALTATVRAGRRVHVLGLASDGGVHSDLSHLIAIGEAARRAGREFFFHAFTDGRDVSPTSGAAFVQELERAGPVATVCGRYYAMDRDRRWERTERAWRALVLGDAPRVDDPAAAVEGSYRRDVTDEFVEPVTTGVARIEEGDAVVFANFRADRARQLTEALCFAEFDGFDRPVRPSIRFAQMTRYRADFDFPVLFPRTQPSDVLGEIFGREGIANVRVAETEKYAHVTYFFNGGREEPFDGEERILVPSPRVATYDLQPEMSAPEVAERAAAAVREEGNRVLVLNFANPDMVGHTGVIEAATRACEAVDEALGTVLGALEERGWTALVTADHGNAECLIDPVGGGPHTAHTTNPVPCWLVGAGTGALRGDGTLADLAPTMLGLLGLPVPGAMGGRDLRTA